MSSEHANTIEEFDQKQIDNLKELWKTLTNYERHNIEFSDLERKLTENNLDIDSIQEMKEALQEVTEELGEEVSHTTDIEVICVDSTDSRIVKDALLEKAEKCEEKAAAHQKRAEHWKREGDDEEVNMAENTVEIYQKKAETLRRKAEEMM